MNQSEVLDKHLPEFMELMRAKIESKNSQYGDFTEYSTNDLLYHFGNEVKELSVELQKGADNSENIAEESIDVGNLAFMLWWSHTYKGVS